MSKESTLITHVVLILFLGLAVYGNSLNGGFVWDDELVVQQNSLIRDWSGIGKFFVGHMFSNTNVGEINYYRPLQMITYTIDHSLWGLNVRGYHLVNILLHVSVALLIYWLVNILYNNKFLSCLTSIFFVTHPIHTEAVSYITGRADPLAALFMVLSLIFYVKTVNTRKRMFCFTSILAYAGAILSRESSLILPLMILLYHYVFERKIKIKVFLAFLGVTLSYVLLRLALLGSISLDPGSETTVFQRLPGFFVAIATYIKLLVFPFDLHMEYGDQMFNFTDPMAIVGVLAVILSLIYIIKKKKNNGLVFFSMSWFFVALLPASNLYPVNAYLREHWLYIPSIGAFLILAKGLSYLYSRKRLRLFMTIVIIGLLSFYSYLTIKQNGYWSDPVVFYKTTLKYAPDNWKIHENLGRAYVAIDKKDEAIISYNRVLELNPEHRETYYNLSATYFRKKQYDLAIKYCDNAIERGLEVFPEFLELLEPHRK
ncbi:MAG: tetratricopeptide repeat protein [Candidatus Omnitrophota bacterium]|nr:tetratricopeptide repeat protein [Candidatus Omnitrophota bacterium]